jgi:hypothetical protein
MDLQNLVPGYVEPILKLLDIILTLPGIGLSTFGGILATIYYFKPQTVVVSTIFLAVVAYVLGELMSHLLPSRGFIGKLLNPHPVSVLEHCCTPNANHPLKV